MNPSQFGVLAHGVGERSDLPLPLGMVAVGAGLAVAFSFAIMGVLWLRPKLESISAGKPLPLGVDRAVTSLGWVARAVVFVIYLAAMGAGFFGVDSPSENLATTSVFIILWVVMQAVSAIFGDVWSAVNPLDTIVAGIERVTGRSTSPGDDADATHWPAVIGLAGFLWMELAYHQGSDPRTVGRAMFVYSVVMVTGGLMKGRGWLRHGGGFSAWFHLLGFLGMFHRNEEGRLSIRAPFVGISQMMIRPGTTALALLVLGSTTFDGLSGTGFWATAVRNLVDWGSTAASTGGFLWMMFVVTVVYLLVTRSVETADRYIPSIVPIALGYIVAHYFSLVVFFGQGFFFGLSDPFNLGWDILGNEADTISYTVVSTNTIAWVQVLAIVIGHILGVAAAHDLVLEDHEAMEPQAIKSGDAGTGVGAGAGVLPGSNPFRAELPLAGVMMFYTMIGLYILMNA